MDKTIDFYNQNACDFIAGTIAADPKCPMVVNNTSLGCNADLLNILCFSSVM